LHDAAIPGVALLPVLAISHRLSAEIAVKISRCRAICDAPQYVITVPPMNGGRRLLSDDVELLAAVGVMVARRIDALRLLEERHDHELRRRKSASSQPKPSSGRYAPRLIRISVHRAHHQSAISSRRRRRARSTP
jgi:hypothetical protein